MSEPLDVRCTACGAAPKAACLSLGQNVVAPHRARMASAQGESLTLSLGAPRILLTCDRCRSFSIDAREDRVTGEVCSAKCARCHHQLSLGPANDASEPVQAEIGAQQ